MLRLLVALDFSDCSREALRVALQIANRAGLCELVLLTVLDDAAQPQGEAAIKDQEAAIGGLHKLVEEEAAANSALAIAPTTKTHYACGRGSPADEIIAHAKVHQVDAVVMGTHGRTGFDRLFAGSVAERVVRLAPCSVLTVKKPG
jgi:nucleotide-binding universal stress UspA family protein